MSPPTEPNFVKNITYVQKILSGVAVTMFLMVWLTGFNFVTEVFKPNFLNVLATMRMVLAVIGIGFTSVVGYPQFGKMLAWAVENYGLLQRLKKLKDESDIKNIEE